MSIYKKIADISKKYIPQHTLFKVGFNISPMYRRSCARITEASKDLLCVKIKLPISYKNRNYVNSIFGGSMFAAVDPIPMIQLMYILGDDYVIWDKSAEILFKRPAKENLYAEFLFTQDEIKSIQKKLKTENEIDVIKTSVLTNKEQTTIFCEVNKTIYIANKGYFKEKQKRRSKSI